MPDDNDADCGATDADGEILGQKLAELLAKFDAGENLADWRPEGGDREAAAGVDGPGEAAAAAGAEDAGEGVAAVGEAGATSA
jgi:hypothetical protein